MRILNMHLLSLMALAFTIRSNCQVTWQNPFPSGNSLSDVTFPTSLNGWCVGAAGQIIATTDGGESWFAQESHTNNTLNAVRFISNSTGWIVGDGIILATNNSGQTWSIQKSLPDVSLQSIDFVNALYGWTCGTGIILSTRDGGSTWGISLSDTLDQFTSVSFENEKTGWVVGTNRVLKSTDGGKTWDDFVAIGGFPQINYQKIQFFGNSGWLIGTDFHGRVYNSEKLAGLVWRTTDEGASWSLVYADTTWFNFIYPSNYFSDGSFIDRSSGYLSTTSEAIITTDGGNTWVHDTISPGKSVYMVDQGTIYTAGFRGYIGKSTDAGHSWNQLSYGSNDHLVRVQFFDDLTGIAAGEGSFLRTTDGGKHWINTTDIFSKKGITISDCSFVNSMTGWISAHWGYYGTGFSYISGLIFKTIDGGYTWAQELDDSSHHRLFAIQFVESNNGIAVGEGEILKTSDGGGTWNRQFYQSNAEPWLYCVAWLDMDHQWTGGDDCLLNTTDGGKSWQTITTLAGMQYYVINRIQFTSGTTGWATGFDADFSYVGFVLKTTDAGITWTKVLTGHSSNYAGMDFLDDFNGYIVGNGAVVAGTLDGGQTWHFTSLPHVTQDLSDIFLQNNHHAWISGFLGTIITVQDIQTPIRLSSVNPVSTTYDLFQNYPNPFNPTTEISYYLPMTSLVTLNIYDVLGRLVTTLIAEPQTSGRHSVHFNATSLTSGVYFYRLTAGRFVSAKKLILIK